MGKDNISAIIQARMDSSRLPGKTMMDIGGKPMLERVVDRVKKAMANVFIVTPPSDLAIINFARNNGIIYSLDRKPRDVLDSYYQCSMRYALTHIVRVTADNPLIDPETIKRVVSFYQENDYDWVGNCRLKTTYPDGDEVEVFSLDTLRKAWNEATSQYDREHVTPYIYNHPELFRLGIVENEIDESHIRWTVDTQEDLDAVRLIYSKQRR